MSNIYIQEPPSNGKVLLTTTLGDIDIELWSKEAPKACRNFVQLCMEGYYDDTIFHRVEKDFIAQGGDPTGTGTGGDSIYGKPFKDEFHQRLKFNRRGLVAMANAGPDDNGSQFFFTLASASELHKKHTIFGKVTGDTIYNMIRFNDLDVDEEKRPFCPPKVIKSQVLFDPFDDIEPRTIKHLHNNKEEKKKEKVKSKSKATKNYKLLSFGEEAEEDEEETDQMTKDIQIKSSHDVLLDPKLSSIPAVDASGKEQKVEESKLPTQKKARKIPDMEKKDESEGDESDDDEKPKKKKRKRSKVDTRLHEISETPVKETRNIPDMEKKDESEGDESDDEKPRKIKRKPSKIEERLQAISRGETPVKNKEKGDTAKKPKENDLLIHLAKEREQFLKKKKSESILKKGQSRQDETLALLASFESKVTSIVSEVPEEEEEEGIDETDLKENSWMTHNLKFVEPKDDAKDASMKGDDWYDIYDPRNPANLRRREKSGKDDKLSTK